MLLRTEGRSRAASSGLGTEAPGPRSSRGRERSGEGRGPAGVARPGAAPGGGGGFPPARGRQPRRSGCRRAPGLRAPRLGGVKRRPQPGGGRGGCGCYTAAGL